MTTQQNINFSKLKASYSLKGKTTINPINFEGSFDENVKKISASGSTLTITLNNNKKFKLTNISNPNNINFVGDYTDSLQEFYEAKFTGSWLPTKAKTTTVTGTVFDENIDVSAYDLTTKGLTIDAGAGNDKITGTTNNDSITGGAGQNTIVIDPDLYTDNNFGKDTINLTAKEGLTVDLSAFGDTFTSADSFKGKFTVSKNDLVLATGKGNLVFKNFAKSNVTGDNENSYVKLKLNNGTLVNLNTDEIFENGYVPTINAKKQTATIDGNRFSEAIALDEDTLAGYTKTINAGNGTNSIDVDSKGKLTINGGSGVDNIVVTKNNKSTTIKAGDGENVIDIVDNTGSNSITTGKHKDTIIVTGTGNTTVDSGKGDDTIVTDAGNDTINAGDGDDYISAGDGNDKLTGGKGADTFAFIKNDGVDTITDATKDDIIQIEGVVKGDLIYAKNGNNLEIFYSDEFDINNKIIVQNHFTKKGRVATTLKVGGEDINLAEVGCIISGSGTINGDAADNTIIGGAKADTIKAGAGADTIYGYAGADTIYGEAGNDKIYAGAGNDKLYGGAGENTFFFNEGDGVDKVYSNGGEDTIQLNKFDSINDLKAGVILSSDGTNLEIQYTENDFVVLDKYYTNKTNSVKKVADKNGNAITIQELIDACEPIMVTGSGKITGTKDDDIINGSAKADTINALDGDDIINGADGNDTLTGGKGTNTYVFADTKFGNDTINLTATENAILDFSDYEDLTEENITFSLSGNNLVIKTANHGQVTITDFKKSDTTGAEGSVMLQLAGGESIDLKEKLYSVKATADYTGSWLNENIDASNATKAITISSGKGDDIIKASAKADTFTFAVGDGNDIIRDANAKDIIQINVLSSDLLYGKDGDDLIISYGDGDSVTIENYYAADNKIDTLKAKNANGKYEKLSLSAILEPEEPQPQGTVLDIDDTTGEISLSKDDGYETLRFVGVSNPNYIHYNVSGDNLVVDYGSAVITLTDYMKGGHSVKQFDVAGTVYDIPYHIGTAGNDTFNAQRIEDHFYLNGGNDTVNFRGQDFTTMNEIKTEGTAQNTTTITFDNYSLEDNQLRFTYFANNGGYNKLDIYAAKNVNGENHFGQATYDYYFSDDKPALIIQDAKSTYAVEKIKTAANIDWTTSNEARSNHVSFLLSTSGTNTVVSNTKTNRIYVNNGGNLNYTYKGGNDKVESDWRLADDTYTVDSFNENTHLYLADNGGNDTVDFVNTASDSIRLFFDIGIRKEFNDKLEEVYTPWSSVETALVYNGAFNTETMTNYLPTAGIGSEHEWVDGIVTLNSSVEFETVSTTDATINLDDWKTAITKNVVEWLKGQDNVDLSSRPSLSQLIKDGVFTSAQLSELQDLFDVKYSDIKGGGEPEEPVETDDCDGTDGNDVFTSTAQNETFNLGKGSDTVNFGKEYGYDYINTEADINSEGAITNKDTLNFSEYSVMDGDFKFGHELGSLNWTMSSVGGAVKYNDFFAENAPNLQITDKDRTYHVDRTQIAEKSTEAVEYSWVSWWEPEQENHMVFIDGNAVDENGEYKNNNYIQVNAPDNYHYVETTGTTASFQGDGYHYYNFTYDYSYGHDKVYAKSEVTNDQYYVQRLDKDTDITIMDAGSTGDDYLYLNTMPAELRAIFEVGLYAGGGIKIANETLFVTTHVKEDEGDYEDGNFSKDTVVDYLSGKKVNGALVDAVSNEPDKFGIERVQCIPPFYYIDVAYYKEKIATNVAGWLEQFGLADEKGYKSLKYTLENAELDDEALEALKECYNVDYTNIPQKPVKDIDGYYVINDVMTDEYTPYDNPNLTGTVYNDRINGNGGSDVIIAGKGDDIIDVTDSTGSKIKYIYAYGDKLQKHGNDKVIGSSNLDELQIEKGTADMTMRFYQRGKDLTIRFFEGNFAADVQLDPTASNGSILIKDYFKESGTPIETVSINGTAHTVESLITATGGLVESNDTLIFAEEPYIRFSVAGNDLILESWAWEESIEIAGYFAGTSEIKYLQFGDAEPVLISEYAHIQIGTDGADSMRGTVTAFSEDYVEGNDDIFIAKGGDDEITPLGGADYVNAGEGKNKILVAKGGYHEDITVANGGGEDTLVFPEGAVVRQDADVDNADDLVLTYEVGSHEAEDFIHGRVTISGYFNGSSVKYVQIGDNKESITEYAPKDWYGTDGNDTSYKFAGDASVTTTVSGKSNDIFHFGKGNDTLKFGADFGFDKVISEGKTNTDTFIFNNHTANQLYFEYSPVYEYNYIEETGEMEENITSEDLAISYYKYDSTTGKEDNMRVKYVDFFSDNSPSLVVKDSKSDVYYVEKYKNAASLELWGSSDVNKNHITFIQSEAGSTTTVASNTKANRIYKMGDGAMTYTYTGGDDFVSSSSYNENASDTYNINSFTKDTKLTIEDNGGSNDVINLKASADSLRMIFNVTKYDFDTNWYGIKYLHTDNFNLNNVKETILGADTDGLEVNATEYNTDDYSYRCGIERFQTTDYEKLDLATWRNQITENVQQWLNNADHTYDSAYNAFQNCTDATALAELVQCYGVKYSDIV